MSAGHRIPMCALCLLTSTALAADYRWDAVALGGGGAVPGLAVHPRVPDLLYLRTDVGGAYRLDPVHGRWQQLLDWLPASSWNHYGVASLTVDPGEADGATLWLAVGKYADESWAAPALGAILRSRDRGATWESTLAIRVASNRDQALGEALAVDPHDGRHVVFASRADGLWSTRDGGATWAAEPGFPRPAGAPWPRLACAVFDPARPGSVTVGAASGGMWRSADGGATWAALAGAPSRLHRAVDGGQGTLLVSGPEGLQRWDPLTGAWTRLTPPGCTVIQAAAADAHDPRRLLACTGGGHGQRLWRSGDGGATWSEATGSRQPTVPWWPPWHWFSAPSTVAFDPHHPGRAWVGDWYGVYRCDDLDAEVPAWSNRVAGIESVVCLGALACPASGPMQLFSGIADVGGFDHRDLATCPSGTIWSNGLPAGMSTTGVAVCSGDPSLVVRVGRQDWRGPGMGGWSEDGGASWRRFARVPGAGGRVAVGADGAALVWAVQGGGLQRSSDRGASWSACEPAAALRGAMPGKDVFVWTQPLAADAVEPSTFYAGADGSLWTSGDGGARFARGALLAAGDHLQVRAAPGRSGMVWVARGTGGLFRSSDRGRTLEAVPGVAVARLLCFGTGRLAGDPPAVYIHGRLEDGAEGLFRSTGLGAAWERIDQPRQRVGDEPNTLAGDLRVFGRVFVGTNGRGILWGEPQP